MSALRKYFSNVAKQARLNKNWGHKSADETEILS